MRGITPKGNFPRSQRGRRFGEFGGFGGRVGTFAGELAAPACLEPAGLAGHVNVDRQVLAGLQVLRPLEFVPAPEIVDADAKAL